MSRTTAEDVIAVLDLLDPLGAEPIIGGGWGIDALIGSQTRDHADVDIVIPAAREQVVLDALADSGYSITTDWRPVRVALSHPDGPEVDVHPVAARSDGTRVQQGLGDVTYEYPAGDITIGTVGGRRVRCLSARLQMRFHDGYPPTPKDIADCQALAAATGLRLPQTVATAIAHQR